VLILGWTDRTVTIVRDLLESRGRLKRFLRRYGRLGLSVVILAEQRAADVVVELRDRLGKLWNERRIIVRTGSVLRPEHLRRVDFLHASVIVVPGADFAYGSAGQADARMLKALLSMTRQTSLANAARLPLLVAELFDAKKEATAKAVYGGPLEIIPSHTVFSRMVVQTIRNPGLSEVYAELLSNRGQRVYVRERGELAGLTIVDIKSRLDEAILLGIVQSDEGAFASLLNPEDDYRVGDRDQLVILAESYDEAAFVAEARKKAAAKSEPSPPRARMARQHRILILGFSDKVPALIDEFDAYPEERFEVHVLSRVEVSKRSSDVAHHRTSPRALVEFLSGDYTFERDLGRLELQSYSSIIIVASDWLESTEAADTRSIIGLLLLQKLLAPLVKRPQLLIELLDPQNAPLVDGMGAEVLISPLLASHMLSQVALRRELGVVFDELFGSRGAELAYRLPVDYGLSPGRVRFGRLEEAAAGYREIAIGIKNGMNEQQVVLNPDRRARLTLTSNSRILVLHTPDPARES
jgi:hypothetical protein